MQGRKCLRGTTLVSRAENQRAFISADIGAARRGLNVLARACSGAMFPPYPPPPFTDMAALFGRLGRYSSLPRMHNPILLFYILVVKKFITDFFRPVI